MIFWTLFNSILKGKNDDDNCIEFNGVQYLTFYFLTRNFLAIGVANSETLGEAIALLAAKDTLYGS